MKNFNLVIGLLISLMIVSGCSKKEDYTEVKKDLTVLRTNWETTGNNLRTVMTEAKSDVEKYGKTQLDLERLAQSKNAATKKEVTLILETTKSELDSLRKEITSLNAYSKEWTEQSKVMNQLITDVKAESIKVAEAKESIAELRKFKALSDPKLKAIQSNLKAYVPKQVKVKEFLAKYEKKAAPKK